MRIILVGVLNVTPDSFSDGGLYLNPDLAIKHAMELHEAGADIIDIGGVSTGPSSSSITSKEEWVRIAPIVKSLSGKIPLSIDTYNLETARRALDSGVAYINDVSGTEDTGILELVARYDAGIMIMYSSSGAPHSFVESIPKDFVKSIKTFLISRKQAALAAGIKTNQIILDPGMGAFLSSNPDDSWELLRRFNELVEVHSSLMLAVSRKGFLKLPGETSASDRDMISALVAEEVVSRLSKLERLFIRVHNPKTHALLRGSNFVSLSKIAVSQRIA